MFPPTYQSRGTPAFFVNVSAVRGGGEAGRMLLLVDNGSNVMLVRSKALWGRAKDRRPAAAGEFILMNSHPEPVVEWGTLLLPVRCARTQHVTILEIENVAFVPTSRYEIFSASAWLDRLTARRLLTPCGRARKHALVTFVDSVQVPTETGPVFGTRGRDGLYTLELALDAPAGVAAATMGQRAADREQRSARASRAAKREKARLRALAQEHKPQEPPAAVAEQGAEDLAGAAEGAPQEPPAAADDGADQAGAAGGDDPREPPADDPDRAAAEEEMKWGAVVLARARELAVLLHEKYNHSASLPKLQQMVRDGDIVIDNAAVRKAFLTLTIPKGEAWCAHCELAGSRKDHPSKNKSAMNDGQYTLDTFGKWQKVSRLGKRYMFVVVAPNRKRVWVYFMRRKREVYHILKTHRKTWEKESGEKMRALRGDRAGEHTSRAVRKFARNHGLRLSFTAPDRSAGPAETYGGILQERAQTLLNASGAPEHFWQDAVIAANQALDCMPMAALDGRSMYEHRTGLRPPLHRLLPFWADVTANIPRARRKKRRNRGRKARLLHQCEDGDGYVLYDPSKRTVFRSGSLRPTSALFARALPAAPAAQAQAVEAAAESSEVSDLPHEARPTFHLPVRNMFGPLAPIPEGQEEEDSEEDQDQKDGDVEELVPAEEEPAEQSRPQRVRAAPANYDPIEYDLAMGNTWFGKFANVTEASAASTPPPAAGPTQAQLWRDRHARAERELQWTEVDRMRKCYNAHTGKVVATEAPSVEESAFGAAKRWAQRRLATREAKAEREDNGWSLYPSRPGVWQHTDGTEFHVLAGEAPMLRHEMLARPDRSYFLAAEEEERANHARNESMKHVGSRADAHLRGKRLVGVKFVYDIKLLEEDSDRTGPTYTVDALGRKVRYKARLVAKGFMQREGVDFGETYAPTPNMASNRLLQALGLIHGWRPRVFDVTAAFLIPRLPEEEEVHVSASPGDPLGPDAIYKLLKCIYGLRQASHHWNQDIDGKLKEFGFDPLTADPCVYVRYAAGTQDLECVLAVHVDDVLLLAPDEVADAVKGNLLREYDMKEGSPEWYLKMKVKRSADGRTVEMSQPEYIEAIIRAAGMETFSRKVSTPADPNTPLQKPKQEATPAEQQFMNSVPMGKVTGMLGYLAATTRPDIAQAVGAIQRHVADPRPQHWRAVLRVVQYLCGTRDYGLRMSLDTGVAQLLIWSDSDWAGCLDTRKSTSGYVVMFLGCAIAWKSKRQPGGPARSSTEAELIALDQAVREALWLRKLGPPLGIPGSERPRIHEDNESCLAIAKGSRWSHASKHMDVKFHAVRYDVLSNKVELVGVRSEDNLADLFTKPLARVKFEKFRELIGVVPMCL